MIESIRNGAAERSQKLSIVSRTVQLTKQIKSATDESSQTELAFLLQACRGIIELVQLNNRSVIYIIAILQSIIKEKQSSNNIMVKLYELYPLLCNLISHCPANLSEPVSHALLAYHPFLSKD